MTPSLLIATAIMDMLVAGLMFCISAWEAYLDARFLTMIATVHKRLERGRLIAVSATRRDPRVFLGSKD